MQHVLHFHIGMWIDLTSQQASRTPFLFYFIFSSVKMGHVSQTQIVYLHLFFSIQVIELCDVF